MELNKYILRKAVAVGLCKEWKEKFTSVSSVDDLLKMYVEGIDFCLSNNFPSNDDLKEFGGDFINQYGIYVDSTLKLSDREFIVLLGKCNVMFNLSSYSVSQLFVKNESNVMVALSENAYMVIDCFDNTNTHVTAIGESKALINVYGNAKVTAVGNCKIELKDKVTY